MKHLKYFLMISCIILFSVSSNSKEPIGYEDFKLGMSSEKVKNILNNKDWVIKYILNGYRVKQGYWIDINPETTLMLELTEGLSGNLSKIFLSEKFYNKNLAIANYEKIKEILLAKYGKPKIIKNMSLTWVIDNNETINLYTQLDVGDDFYLQLQYSNIQLMKKAEDYQKRENKRVKDENIKSQINKY